MTFDELLEEVYLITNRRDLENETKSAIKAATLKAHHSDYYSKDIYETGITWPGADYRQSIDLYSLITNFRQLKYLRKATDENDDSGTFLNVILPEQIVDAYGVNREDIAYVAGRILEVRSSTVLQYALLGAYVSPIVREGAYSSWVAELQPYAIIHEAARRIFFSIGNREEALLQRELAAEEFAELKIVGLTDIGY